MAEKIYQQSIEVELMLRNIPFISKPALSVSYKNYVLSVVYEPDLLVYDEIIAELKAVSALLPEHRAQLFNYMRISKKKVGYLINYGTPHELEWERLVL